MKAITLPGDSWRKIIALIEVSPVEDDHRLAAALREQLSGSVSVKATRSGIVTMRASKGGDLRNSAALK